MRRILVLGALVLALLGVAACSDDDEPAAPDPSVPATDEPGTTTTAEVFEPPEGGDDDPTADELDALLAATVDAGGGTYELVDEVGGGGTVTGAFQQEPLGYTATFADDVGSGTTTIVVADDTTYVQRPDGTWQDDGPAQLDSDVLLDVGPVPSLLLEILVDSGDPEVLDPESGGTIFRWTSTGEAFGLSVDDDDEAVAEVQADAEGRFGTLTISQEEGTGTFGGGDLTIDFAYDDAAPPITAPANVPATGES